MYMIYRSILAIKRGCYGPKPVAMAVGLVTEVILVFLHAYNM